MRKWRSDVAAMTLIGVMFGVVAELATGPLCRAAGRCRVVCLVAKAVVGKGPARKAGCGNTATTAAEGFAVVYSVGGETAAPYAAGVQADDAGIGGDARNGGPVAKEYTAAFQRRVGQAEPGIEAVWNGGEVFLVGKVHTAIKVDQTHAGEEVGNHAQAGAARELIAPDRGLIAIHIAEKAFDIRALQGCLDFTCALARLLA